MYVHTCATYEVTSTNHCEQENCSHTSKIKFNVGSTAKSALNDDGTTGKRDRISSEKPKIMEGISTLLFWYALHILKEI